MVHVKHSSRWRGNRAEGSEWREIHGVRMQPCSSQGRCRSIRAHHQQTVPVPMVDTYLENAGWKTTLRLPAVPPRCPCTVSGCWTIGKRPRL